MNAVPLPAGLRARRVDGVNGLSVHLLEAGFDAGPRPLLLLLHGLRRLHRTHETEIVIGVLEIVFTEHPVA